MSLVLTIKKTKEWIIFRLEDGRKIEVLIKDHKSGNNTLSKVVINCDRSISIDKEENQEMGNSK